MMKQVLLYIMITFSFPFGKEKHRNGDFDVCYLSRDKNYSLCFGKDGDYELSYANTENSPSAIISYGKFREIDSNSTVLFPIVDEEINHYCTDLEHDNNIRKDLMILNNSNAHIWIIDSNDQYNLIQSELRIKRKTSIQLYSQVFGSQTIRIDSNINKIIIHPQSYCIKRYGRRMFANFLVQRTLCLKNGNSLVFGRDSLLFFFERKHR